MRSYEIVPSHRHWVMQCWPFYLYQIWLKQRKLNEGLRQKKSIAKNKFENEKKLQTKERAATGRSKWRKWNKTEIRRNIPETATTAYRLVDINMTKRKRNSILRCCFLRNDEKLTAFVILGMKSSFCFLLFVNNGRYLKWNMRIIVGLSPHIIHAKRIFFLSFSLECRPSAVCYRHLFSCTLIM